MVSNTRLKANRDLALDCIYALRVLIVNLEGFENRKTYNDVSLFHVSEAMRMACKDFDEREFDNDAEAFLVGRTSVTKPIEIAGSFYSSWHEGAYKIFLKIKSRIDWRLYDSRPISVEDAVSSKPVELELPDDLVKLKDEFTAFNWTYAEASIKLEYAAALKHLAADKGDAEDEWSVTLPVEEMRKRIARLRNHDNIVQSTYKDWRDNKNFFVEHPQSSPHTKRIRIEPHWPDDLKESLRKI